MRFLAFLLLATFGNCAEVGIKLKAECGQGPLSYLGVVDSNAATPEAIAKNEEKFEAYRKQRNIIFDFLQVSVEPVAPNIPGCFNLTANNVTITRRVRHLAAEFHMSIGGNRPDFGSAEKLPCREKPKTECDCGAENSCMYCDFCKHFKNKISAEVIQKREITDDEEEDQCSCSIAPGVYDLRTEICTPNREKLEEFIPAEVFSQVDASVSFTLWTTLFVYTDQLNVEGKSMAEVKKENLGGCAIIGTDISIQ